MNKRIASLARYAGLVTICFEWLAVLLFFVVKPADFSGDRTISYFATLPETHLIFSVCLTVAAASFWVFTRYHLRNYYVVPVRLFAVSMLGYVALALTPYDPANIISDIVHRALAIFFSITFLAGIYLMGKHNKNTKVHPVSYGTVALSGLVLGLFFVVPPDSQLLLPLEGLSAFIGQVWVVWISFHSFKKVQ